MLIDVSVTRPCFPHTPDPMRYWFAIIAPFFIVYGRLQAGEPVEFNRDVRPILADHCFACHGPDASKRQGKLRLDVRDSALKRQVIVPGKPDDSVLMSRVLATNDDQMPPVEFHKPLSEAQKRTLRRWIEQGAEYQPHWAWVPPRRLPPPAVRQREWVRNPIDAFILARLEKENVPPSPEAARRTLIRRVYLDLIGIPPTPEQVAAFIQDRSANAYEKMVESLLASPHFGERLAVPWLDLVRFADTVGYHGDQNQNIFPYRDYVIDSFNQNKPFDVFTREQLAGDLLPNPTIEQRVATGFNRLNMMTREGGAQPKEYLAKYQADRVRTVGMAWLGVTLGCAECHDHKYDPFTMKDFYSMSAFFADVRQWGVYNDYTYTPNPDLRGWSNDHPFPPELEVESPYLKRRVADLMATLLRVAETPDQKATNGMAVWQKAAQDFLHRHPSGWQVPTPAGFTDAEALPDKSLLVTAPVKKGGTFKFTLTPEPTWVSSVKLELLPHERHGHRITRNNADQTSVQFSLKLQPAAGGPPQDLDLFFGHADRQTFVRYANTAPILGVMNGWRTQAGASKKPHTAVWMLDRPIQLMPGDSLHVTITSDHVGCVRLSFSPFGLLDPVNQKLAAISPSANHGPDATNGSLVSVKDEVAFLLSTGADADVFARTKALRREITELRGGRAFTQVTVAAKPMTVRLLPRGNWLDDSGPVMEPAVPGFLPQPPTTGGRLTRLDLANWLTDPNNPLTARVFVNRLWKQFFGTGLSAVMEDVGAQGEAPQHPELLDWLACEFRDPTLARTHAWDVKHMVRLMVTSATYRQDSVVRTALKDRDPNNRWVSFMPPRRLDAEFVRDNALAIAGLLNRDLGGPSVKPYQPDGYYANLQFPNRRYVADRDDRQYRRGVYVHWQRTFLHPMLANFDAPSREECTANRPLANTPQQALTLLNDPTFVEAARGLAIQIHSPSSASDAERLTRAFERAVARAPRPPEQDALLRFLAVQRDHYRTDPQAARKLLSVGYLPNPKAADAVELAAWTNVCRVILNLHETMTRY
jgi:hypothetical protein